MNISPVSYNQNQTRTKNSPQAFGMIQTIYSNQSCAKILDILATKFPIGTEMHSTHFKTRVKHNSAEGFSPIEEYSHTEVSIKGLSQAAENLIALAIKATEIFSGVGQTPHKPTKESKAILAGLKELGVSDKEAGTITKTEETVIK